MQQQADMLRQALNEHDARNKALKQQLQNEVQQRNGAEQLCNAKMEEARVLSAVCPGLFLWSLVFASCERHVVAHTCVCANECHIRCRMYDVSWFGRRYWCADRLQGGWHGMTGSRHHDAREPGGE